MTMTQDRIHGIRRQLGGMLKEWLGRLSGDAAFAAKGKQERIAGRSQEQRAISRRAADRQIAEFRDRNRHWADLSKH
jgi:uncharacterized protein YjbJ (UPF0337 family)